MELELIYNRISCEDARYALALKRLECRKIEEEIKHIKILLQLKEDKEKLLKAQIEKHLKSNPKGGYY